MKNAMNYEVDIFFFHPPTNQKEAIRESRELCVIQFYCKKIAKYFRYSAKCEGNAS
jgi:hypothetical protein